MDVDPSPPHPRRSPISPIVGLVGAALLSALTLAAQWDVDGNRRIDFRIYVRAVRSIGDLGLYGYGTGILRFTYPPAAAVAIWPLTWLDETTGSRAWLVLSILAFVAAYTLAFRSADGPRSIPAGLALVGASAALWSAPAMSTLRLGQINALVALLVCADAVAIGRRSRWAGIGVGVAAAIKVTPLAVLPVLWAAGRNGAFGSAVARRAAAVFVAIGLAGAAVAPDSTRQFLDRLGGRAVDRTAATSVDLRMLLRSTLGSAAVADALWIVASIALVLLALRTAARLAARAGAPDGIGLVTVGMCCSTVVSPFSSVHHLTFATVAVALWAARATSERDRVVAAFGLLAVLDPTAGDLALGRWAMVTFCIVTVVALPATRPGTTGPSSTAVGSDPDFADDGAIPQDVGLLRGGH